MSAPATTPVGPGTIITVKVTYDDHTRRFKIALRDLGARTLPQNLRLLLGIPADTDVIFERYSDSASSFVVLDSNNQAVFKQLYRAAKAKLKLRIRATVVSRVVSPSPAVESSNEQQDPPRYSYLDTVLSSPIAADQAEAKDSATTSSTALPESSKRSPIYPVTILTSTEMSNPKATNHREFVSGLDDPTAPVVSHTSLAGVFCIDCNNCSRPIPNEHYHCNTCADGDYDLCPRCVDAGVNCLGEDHWLVRRFVKDGIITNSTTKTLASHKITAPEEEPLLDPVPDSALEPTEKVVANAERICNNCLQEFDEGKMVSCADCEDFDLCITCVLGYKHGHHPSHTFVLLGEHDSGLKNLVLSRCKPGRGYHHAAICDGCEGHITGVRHKCLTCPDWDYCSDCHLSASRTHPGHRFAPLYTAISEPLQSHEVHYGVYCDGPLCIGRSGSSFITGVRYKCSVCHDTDYCAKCEVHPANTHNRTHPMVMLKTPVRSVSVNTVHENELNTTLVGDHQTRKSASTQAPAAPISLQLPVETDAEPMETECSEEAGQALESSSLEELDLVKEESAMPQEIPSADPESEYQAFFLEDAVADGTMMRPNQVFRQNWRLYNPGPLSWPSGSSVRFVGGDSMFNLDTNHPSSVASVTAAMESNQLSKPLEAGQTAEFSVTLKAPSRVGTAISYWRMKLSDGTPFGHRLWCDVQVRDDLVEEDDVFEIPQKVPELAAEPSAEASDLSRSQMVFPKLDKESPAASTHEAISEPSAAPSVSNPPEHEHDVFDDLASLTMDDADTEAGFLTDEEYDILDASDQEFADAVSTRK